MAQKPGKQRKKKVINTYGKARPSLSAHAKHMAKRPTPSEELLRDALRAKYPTGLFTPQYAIGEFIVDFYCRTFHLVIEVDGRSHSQPLTKARDRVLETFVARQGGITLRFTNTEIKNKLPGVLDTIHDIMMRCMARSHDKPRHLSRKTWRWLVQERRLYREPARQKMVGRLARLPDPDVCISCGEPLTDIDREFSDRECGRCFSKLAIRKKPEPPPSLFAA